MTGYVFGASVRPSELGARIEAARRQLHGLQRQIAAETQELEQVMVRKARLERQVALRRKDLGALDARYTSKARELGVLTDPSETIRGAKEVLARVQASNPTPEHVCRARLQAATAEYFGPRKGRAVGAGLKVVA